MRLITMNTWNTPWDRILGALANASVVAHIALPVLVIGFCVAVSFGQWLSYS